MSVEEWMRVEKTVSQLFIAHLSPVLGMVIRYRQGPHRKSSLSWSWQNTDVHATDICQLLAVIFLFEFYMLVVLICNHGNPGLVKHIVNFSLRYATLHISDSGEEKKYMLPINSVKWACRIKQQKSEHIHQEILVTRAPRGKRHKFTWLFTLQIVFTPKENFLKRGLK